MRNQMSRLPVSEFLIYVKVKLKFLQQSGKEKRGGEEARGELWRQGERRGDKRRGEE